MKQAIECLNTVHELGKRKYEKEEKPAEEEDSSEGYLSANMHYGPTEFALDPNLAEDIMPFQVTEAYDRAAHASDMVLTSTTDVPWDFMTSAMPRIDQKLQPAMEKWALMNINKQLQALSREMEAKGELDQMLEPLNLVMTDNYYPTVKAYLELLPEEYRSKPLIRELAVMMDKRMFNVPLENKQELLNMAVAYQLPTEDCRERLT